MKECPKCEWIVLDDKIEFCPRCIYKAKMEPIAEDDDLIELYEWQYEEQDEEVLDNSYVPPKKAQTYSTIQTYSNPNIPKCPTCQSTNIQKIGGLERGVSVAAWGLFSKKINKSFKCKNCGYTW